MGLVDSFGAPPPFRGTRPCSFKSWLDSLDPADADAVRTALYRDRGDPLYWSASQMHAVLVDAGWSGSSSVTLKHRSPKACLSCRG